MAEAVSLETIARQLDLALSRLDALAARISDLIGMAEHNTATVAALAAEVREMAEAVGRADRR